MRSNAGKQKPGEWLIDQWEVCREAQTRSTVRSNAEKYRPEERLTVLPEVTQRNRDPENGYETDEKYVEKQRPEEQLIAQWEAEDRVY